MSKPVRVRFAPSPTGLLHVGGLRTALYNFLLARKTGGQFILRVEDTDQARIVPGALENIVQTFDLFGMTPDEGYFWDAKPGAVKERGESGPYKQSERLDLYQEHAQKLIDANHAYYCFCSPERLTQLRKEQEAQKLPPKYDKLCLNLPADEVRKKLAAKEKYVVRLNVEQGQTIEFEDELHGKISISSNDVDDQVLLKSDGFPTYHLAVVVDDNAMNISHVIRGEEWIPSTPKHVLLYQHFGYDVPRFVHLPLLLSKTRKKLSKREGDVAVKEFVEQGYLKQALINFVAFLGWNPKTEQEIFSLDELIEQFDLKKLNKAGAVFDLEKLDWINGLYIRKLSVPELLDSLRPYLAQAGIELEKFDQNFLLKIVALEQERLKKFSEIGERVAYFFKQPEYEADLLIWKKSEKQTIKNNLQALSEFIKQLDIKSFTLAELETQIKQLIEQNNLKTGEVLWPLRVALSGLDASPGPFEIMDAFGALPDGKQIIVHRIQNAIAKL